MHCFPRASLLGCFASAALAQTFIVDAANGPGTHFTEIATAVAVVPDGAVLDVRAGNYASFTIASKGMSVLCASGVTVPSGLGVTVTGTTATQTVLLRGLRSAYGPLSLVGCQGLVVLQDCDSFPSGRIEVTGCAQVHAANCLFGGFYGTGATIDNSTAVFRDCVVTGGYDGMHTTASRVQLVDCSVACTGYPSGPAIWMGGRVSVSQGQSGSKGMILGRLILIMVPSKLGVVFCKSASYDR